jgi:dCMP deaminase
MSLATPSSRPLVEDILMRSAMIWAERSTCARGNVGAVIALDGRTVSTGYNGAPRGLPHCNHDCTCSIEHIDTGLHADWCPEEMARLRGCQVSVHAEANAIAFAARHGVALEGATLFTTHAPCVACSQLIINAGIGGVIYLHDYRITDGRELLVQVGIPALAYETL